MYLLVHASVGAVVGERIHLPVLALGAGFLSHFLLDIIPHGDEASGRELFKAGRRHWVVLLACLDLLAAFSVVTTLWLAGLLPNALGAMSGALGAVLPDVLAGLSEFSARKLWPDFLRLHNWAHRLLGFEVPSLVGGIIQLLTILSAWFVQAAAIL